MTKPETLAQRITHTAAEAPDPAITAFAEELGGSQDGALAVLFYGSNRRTGSLDGVLDFYILTDGTSESGIWPRVGYREWMRGNTVLRAKIAVMTLAKFTQAAAGNSRDTTIWARFVQPASLVWHRDAMARADALDAMEQAVCTAARLALALGPAEGPERAYWSALFRETYRAEFRVEAPGRENSILDLNAAHFDGLLPLAMAALGIAYTQQDGVLRPTLPADARAATLRWWRRRRRMGKALNIARLVKAARTFDGAARYAAWKVERHTGMAVEVTPWRERHPVLAAPGVLFSLWRERQTRRRGR